MLLRAILCASAMSALFLGCGSAEPPARYVSSNSAALKSDAPAPAVLGLAAPAAREAGNAFRQNDASSQQTSQKAQAIDQKIIYTGNLSVVARDFDAAEPMVRELVRKHKGYVADAQIQRNQGSRPSATWVVRTPAENFDDCMHDLAGLGVPETQRVSTQDVGEEYVDVQSRVTSKKKIEERILEMLKDRKGDLKEVMDLEAKLGSVREEIERAQGRLNFLTNRVAFSTIHLTLREEREYVPPQTPDFAGQVADAWRASTGSFMKCLQRIAIVVVSIAPWLPLWLLLAAAAWIVARRIHRLNVEARTSG
jgi:hypothetical protein